MARSLKTYESKRDFSRTAEPSGKGRAARADRRRFVIQKHAATRLHYDLRLEHDGVFLSWAVTRGPSLDPADKRLAVEVEDHPLPYGDFEGTIPKGQYGGGTVMLWDRGYWEPQDGMDVAAGLKKGELKVTFAGERLKGGWVLVRMPRRPREKRDNWLMIKHRDGFEREGDADALLEDNAVSIASGRTMEQIAAGKGKAPTPFMTGRKRKADAVWNSQGPSPEASGETAAADHGAPKAKAKARPGKAKGKKAAAEPLPRFVPPQLARLVDRPPAGGAWGHEIKFDGYRMQLRVQGAKARLLTRKGLDWTDKFSAIAKAGAALPDGLYDGEVVALDAHSRPDFAALQAALSNGRTGGLVYFMFDLLHDGNAALTDRPLVERKAALQAVLAEVDPEGPLRFVEHFGHAGAAVLESACRMDLEGVVSKRLDAPYRSGRSDTWLKTKCGGGQEVIVAGYATTNGAFRSLIGAVRREGELVHVGRIGTGFGKAVVDDILPRLKALETETSPFGKSGPKGGKDIHWLKPELVAEINFAGWTGDGHLRHASFKGLREDKAADDVVRETPRKTTRMSKRSNVVLGVSLSNPDKVLWPAEGKAAPVTKLDHARYLEAVADQMIPHIRGRPCSLIRTPDGIEGKQKFFQRHAGAGTSSLITLIDVPGDKEPYLQIDTPEALIAAAQSGATEFHPWNCAPGDVEHAGRLIFDLDPDPSVGFPTVVEAAKAVRDRLESLGLNCFLKTTGGKGLHVVTPLKTDSRSKVPWPEAKAFAREVCARMAADEPDRYTIVLAKKARGGRIFLDYLRNDRTSTAVAPWSARARPGATVSMPIAWTQATRALDPRRFTIHTAPALMKKSDPWADYPLAAASLKAAIRKLG